MSNTKIWKTKDGRKIRIKDLDDGHLVNCIKMIERNVAWLQSIIPPPMFNGEMAQLYADREYDRMVESGPDYFFPIYDDLCEEATRRQLSWNKS